MFRTYNLIFRVKNYPSCILIISATFCYKKGTNCFQLEFERDAGMCVKIELQIITRYSLLLFLWAKLSRQCLLGTLILRPWPFSPMFVALI